MQKIVLWSKHSYITQKLLTEHLSSYLHLQSMLEAELTLFFFGLAASLSTIMQYTGPQSAPLPLKTLLCFVCIL